MDKGTKHLKIRPKLKSKDQENLISASLKTLSRKSREIKSYQEKRMQSNQQQQ
jgi:hypothetical protein